MSLLEKNQYFISKQKNVSALKRLQSNSFDLTVVRISQNQKCKKETERKKYKINQKQYATIRKIKKLKKIQSREWHKKNTKE